MSQQKPYILPHLRRFRLFDLPAEIRDAIFEIHFFGSTLTKLPICFRPNPFKTENYSVLEVNRQLYQEASAVLDRGAVLHLNFDDWLSNYCDPIFTRDVDHLSLAGNRLFPVTSLMDLEKWPRLWGIRHFRLSVSRCQDKGSNADFARPAILAIVAVLRQCTKVESLTLQIEYDPKLELENAIEPFLELSGISKALCCTCGRNTLCFPHCCDLWCRSCGGIERAQNHDEDRRKWSLVLGSRATIH